VPVRSLPYEEVVSDLRDEDLAWLGDDVLWFDAHTHIGHADPDGREADPEELIEALDRAGQARALVFPMQEPDGYAEPNTRVLEACAASNGRLLGLVRVDPKATGALDEVRRGLAAGARGVKLHPRSDAFGLPHPVVEDIVALVGAQRGAVLFHAGRGIPELGDSIVAMAQAHPDARLILAHAGISDLGLLGPQLAGLPNVLFDTAWWMVADLLTLYTTVPPGQILYASDMPYGGPFWASMAMMRCARAAGLTQEQVRGIAGAQLQRVVDGDDLLDLGDAPGTGGLGTRVLGLESAMGHLTAAVSLMHRQGDPTEPLALARLACQVSGEPEHAAALRAVDAWIAEAQRRTAAADGDPYPGVFAAMAAHILAGTAAIPRMSEASLDPLV
jgi:predicted TIM-barrel fold metal-dependent hydrolase